MKKIFLIVILTIAAFGFRVSAQEQSSDNHFVIGARAGIDIFNMRYSNDDMKIYRHHYGVREQLGIFAEYDYLWKGLAIRTDLLYSPRGVKLTWGDINYRLRAYYFDIRVPITYTFLRDKMIQPYVMFAPNVNFALGGNSRYSNENRYYLTELSKANYRKVDFSLFFGAGVKAPITIGSQNFYVGGEFGYNLGLCNTFSKMELDNSANAINLPMYEVNGTRKNGGFELAVTFAWVVPNKNHASSSKGKHVSTAEPVTQAAEANEQSDNMVEYKAKDCYSIEEMQAFITLKMSLEDKRICMFDTKFEFASAILEKESEEQLDKFVELYRQFPAMKLQINGHTDNVGSDEYNQKLSEDRARSVFDYFVKQGIPENNMKIKGFGSKYPIDTNDTEEGRAKNRRVEVDIHM